MKSDNKNKLTDGFVVSQCNKKAVKKCCKLVSDPHKGGSMVFVVGESACGKTALLHSIAQLYYKKYCQTAMFVTFQAMIDDLVDCIKDKNQEPFFEKYGGSRLLLIDDVQCAVGLDAVQKELAKIFKRFIADGTNIIMCSECGLNKYRIFKRRLSREKTFTVCKISEADFYLRKKVLNNVINTENALVSKRVYHYLATNKKIKISSLKGCVLYIKLMTKIDNSIVDDEIISTLKKYENNQNKTCKEYLKREKSD